MLLAPYGARAFIQVRTEIRTVSLSRWQYNHFSV